MMYQKKSVYLHILQFGILWRKGVVLQRLTFNFRIKI